MQLVDVYLWATQSSRNATLKEQIAAAIAIAAVQILAEPTSTDFHLERIAWAANALAVNNAPLQMADLFTWGVLGNTTIQTSLSATSSVADSDVQFVVNSLINTYKSV